MDDEFNSVTSGAFSVAENQMGTELYETTVEHNKVVIANMALHGKRIEAVTNAIGSAVTFGIIFGLLTMIPVLVFLWKWALSR